MEGTVKFNPTTTALPIKAGLVRVDSAPNNESQSSRSERTRDFMKTMLAPGILCCGLAGATQMPMKAFVPLISAFAILEGLFLRKK